LIDRGLTEFGFQRNLTRTLFDAFQGQRSSESRGFLLDSVLGIIQEFGQFLESGWPSILQILIVAARDAVSMPRAFEIFCIIIKKKIDFLRDFVSQLIELITVYSRKGAHCEPSFFPAIANLLSVDSELWLPLVRTIDNSEGFAAVLGMAAAKQCPIELIDTLIETELPRFCVDNSAEFFARLFSNLTPLLIESKEILIKLLLFGLSKNETAAGAIPSFTEFAKEIMNHEEISIVFETIKSTIPTLNIENTVAFAHAIQTIGIKLPDGGQEFLTELGEIVSHETNEEKCSIITAGIQLELMKCLEQRTPINIEDLAECVKTTFEKISLSLSLIKAFSHIDVKVSSLVFPISSHISAFLTRQH
jgi:hypothetical protein